MLFKNILFTIFVPGMVAFYMPLIIGRKSPFVSDGTGFFNITALLLLSLGAAIYFLSLWAFSVIGRGTPAPIDPPVRLVVTGLYQYVRNPMYLGVLIAILGWALYFCSWKILVYGVLVGLLFHLFVVLVEEPILRRKFKDEYISYCKEVGRWIPGKAKA